jgi:hypothetical protein
MTMEIQDYINEFNDTDLSTDEFFLNKIRTLSEIYPQIIESVTKVYDDKKQLKFFFGGNADEIVQGFDNGKIVYQELKNIYKNGNLNKEYKNIMAKAFGIASKKGIGTNSVVDLMIFDFVCGNVNDFISMFKANNKLLNNNESLNAIEERSSLISYLFWAFDILLNEVEKDIEIKLNKKKDIVSISCLQELEIIAKILIEKDEKVSFLKSNEKDINKVKLINVFKSLDDIRKIQIGSVDHHFWNSNKHEEFVYKNSFNFCLELLKKISTSKDILELLDDKEKDIKDVIDLNIGKKIEGVNFNKSAIEFGYLLKSSIFHYLLKKDSKIIYPYMKEFVDSKISFIKDSLKRINNFHNRIIEDENLIEGTKLVDSFENNYRDPHSGSIYFSKILGLIKHFLKVEDVYSLIEDLTSINPKVYKVNFNFSKMDHNNSKICVFNIINPLVVIEKLEIDKQIELVDLLILNNKETLYKELIEIIFNRLVSKNDLKEVERFVNRYNKDIDFKTMFSINSFDNKSIIDIFLDLFNENIIALISEDKEYKEIMLKNLNNYLINYKDINVVELFLRNGFITKIDLKEKLELTRYYNIESLKNIFDISDVEAILIKKDFNEVNKIMAFFTKNSEINIEEFELVLKYINNEQYIKEFECLNKLKNEEITFFKKNIENANKKNLKYLEFKDINKTKEEKLKKLEDLFNKFFK